MKRKLIWGLMIILAESAYSQLAPGLYLVWLKDKEHSTHTLSHPETFLSERAIQRRIRQGIPFDYADLPVSSYYTDSLQKMGIRIHTTSHWLNTVVIESYDTLLLDTLEHLSFIQSIQTGMAQLKSGSNASIPDKFLQERNEPFHAKDGEDNYGMSYRQISMLNGDKLHDLGFRGQGMVIAVIDAGFYRLNEIPAFDSLRNDGRILGMHAFVTGDASVFEDHWHGMSVMSIMGGNIPGDLVGTATSASYWLLRSENANSEYQVEEDNWIAAAEFADSAGADIINSSLGYSHFDWPFQDHSYSDMDGQSTRISCAADIASRKGMLVVVSAGNEGSKSWKYIMAPADARQVLAVGAVDTSAKYVSFSSKGPSFDRRVKPNVVAQGRSVWLQQTPATTGTGSGTSFSAPIISGLAACLWQAFPQLTSIQIRSAIEKSSSQYDSPDSLLGYGLPDFLKAMQILDNNKLQPSTANQSCWAYPNPFHDEFTLLLKEDVEELEALVEIFDGIGKMVYSKSFLCTGKYTFTLSIPDVSRLDKGIYIIRCTTNESLHQIKIIKQ
jgi:serine protease AprX